MKRTYYVSLPLGKIWSEAGNAENELEIEADSDEIKDIEATLASLLRHTPSDFHQNPGSTWMDAGPGLEYTYENRLHDMYQSLYRLGTAETRKIMKEWDVLF